ncbi:helix-turn-helix domain-containing protein [Microbispora sp. CA-135349]|uniref:helix-turn-helix domain-containing protein n=1 Tax=Microbispora sp. CA-135349 TaxID=3239953 RepID=UPI003D932A1F
MIELRSEDLPTAERFPWWCELTARQMYPTLLSSDHADDYRAAVKVLELGRVTVAVPEFDCMRAVRTQRLIRRSDPEVWTLTLICGGSLWIEQDRERHELRIGDLVLQDPSRPFRSEALEAGGVARTVQLDLPRRSLPVPEQLLRGHASRPLPSRRGVGVLLARMLEELVCQGDDLSPVQCVLLGDALIELATAFLAGVVDRARVVPVETRQRVLMREIKAFVQRHLGRADLSPSSIAAAHHISVRYLHRLFQQEGITVGGHIRRQRLERCRADLADGRLSRQSVERIAARWGFRDAASFSRVFKTAYGMPPGAYRRSAAGAI